ncbi:MarR family winged helix-turn-helix transcriptional regulator [Streptomyces angustmyceticus]
MKDPHESAGADGDEATATGGPTTAEALTQDPAPAEDPAEDLLYGIIRRLWPLHRTVVRAVERELAGTGMTAGEHALLDALRTEGPRTVPQLARGMGLDRQPVQRWVNHAVELGLVVTAPNPAHRRSSLIRLTPRGTEAIRGVQEFEATQLRRRLADLPAEDVRTALHVLDRLGEEFRHLANGQRPTPEETDSTDSPDSHRNHPNSDNGGDSGITPTPLHPAHKGRSRR